MPNEEFLTFAILLIALAGAGYRTYIAWFRPQQHQQYLERIGRLYRGWDPAGEKWWSSPINFWIMRFVFLGGLLLANFALIHRIYILVL